MSEFDIILDRSQQNLKEVPSQILQMNNLKMLYLQQNFIKALPKNFFQKLPLLTWLDLRNNHLTTIPPNIAHHQYLENLLLSENKIEALPNELGLVPKLKVLQISNNPLVYPNAKVISEGTRGICTYLRHQYEKKTILLSEYQENKYMTLEEDKETKIEKEIRVMADYCNDIFPMQESVDSSLVVKGLSKVKKEDSGIIHRITSIAPNKLLLQSFYNEDDDKFSRQSSQTRDSMNRVENPLKSAWVEKLKQLLDEQETILQQERNLQALNTWRMEKKIQPQRMGSGEIQRLSPPYATDPNYDSILTRDDMQKEIDRMIQNSKRPPKKDDIDKLINDLVSKLKEMENTYGGELQSPRTEIESAGNQITKILEMHKQLMQLRKTNDLMLQ